MASPQPQQSQSPRTAARRRQRSTRLTVAVVLLVISALLVAWAVVDDLAWLRSVAAVVAVLLGATATRITHSELMATRREAARDRAQQAADYRDLTERRTAENAVFAADMRRKIKDREEAIGALEQALSKAQRLAMDQTRKLNTEARRADLAEDEGARTARRLEDSESRAAEAIVRVAELEAELDVLRAELRTWQVATAKRESA